MTMILISWIVSSAAADPCNAPVVHTLVMALYLPPPHKTRVLNRPLMLSIARCRAFPSSQRMGRRVF